MKEPDNDPELETRLHPFTIRDALYLHDKRLNQLTDTNHDTQKVVQAFEERFKTLMERINEGVSPTMQSIKDKSNDIEKQIVQLDAKIELKFSEVNSRINVQETHLEDKFEELDAKFMGIDSVFGNFRGLLWKLAGSAIVAIATAFVSMWIFFETTKAKIDSLPSQQMETKQGRTRLP